MGCDIHAYAEVKIDGKWNFADHIPFCRSYGLFGFLGGARNYSEAEPIAAGRGTPIDISEEVEYNRARWDDDGHSFSWVSLEELLNFDYSKKFYDMRVFRDGDGAARARTLDEAELTDYKTFLPGIFFEELERLRGLGRPADVRIIFWFDN